jgi:HTH-type transcriptional regulator/antitoxin HigA
VTLKKRFAHEPDYAVAPGEVLQETIDALGMTQADLAARTGLSRKTINQIVQGQEPLSVETALRLEKVTGTPASFWNNLEALYRERLARQAERERLAQDLAWLDSIPTRELIRRGVIEHQKDRVSLLLVVLRFFGVNSPAEWQEVWGNLGVSFRKSQAFQSRLGAVATWLRLGELAAQKVACRPFDKERFKTALAEIRRLTTEPPEVFVPGMQELCAAAGVAVVLVRKIPGAPVSGAAYWLSSDKAVIQLTLRGKTNDLVWFAFFHEGGHVLKHGKKNLFVDDGQEAGDQEEEANRFATDFLIPRSRAPELAGLRSREQIVAFARSVGVAPGVVLGRLQKEGLAPYQHRDNDLKVRLRWADDVGSCVTSEPR